MAWYHQLLNVVRPARLARDLDREIDFHLAERADDLVAAGMSGDDARREARRRFGNRAVQRERSHDVSVLVWLESLVSDVRYATRALRASPAFTSVVVLSLGLGIGANTAIFSLVDAVMLSSLPVREPETLMRVTMGERGTSVTNPIWEELRDRQDVFDGAFAVGEVSFDLTSGGESRRVEGSWVGGDFFATLGVRPSAGRLVARADDVRGCAATAVLSHGYWQSAYGGDPAAVGRTISLHGHAFTIVGVAQRGFDGVEVGRATQIFAPLCSRAVIDGSQRRLDARSSWYLDVIGRRKRGVTEDQVRARLDALSPAIFGATVPQDWNADGQRNYLTRSLTAEPAAKGLPGLRDEYSRALLTVMVVVGVVLLVACANVANLLLARASARQREFAVRIAVGAGRGRIVRQLLTESLLLALAGSVAGLLFAHWGSRFIVRLLSGGEGVVSLDLALDGRVLAFAFAVTVGTALLFGLAPALRAMHVNPQVAMKVGRSIAAGGSRFGVSQALVSGQVALSLALVASAGLLLGTFRTLATLDTGFEREGVLLVRADLRKLRLSADRRVAVHEQLLEGLRAMPGVRSASASRLTPIGGSGWNTIVKAEGFAPKSADDALIFFNAVSDGYFETMGTPRIAGREFTDHDRPGAPLVAVVTEAFARRIYGGVNPLGKRFDAGLGPQRSGSFEVVGVVRDTKYESLREEQTPVAYIAMRQDPEPGQELNFELRTAGAPAGLISSVTATIARIDPAISLVYTTLADQVDRSLARERLLATLSGFFGALALLLAVVGLYGTMAYSVARRRNEIGIRLALGAARNRVLWMILGDAGRVVAAGLVLGAMLALATTRLVSSFLFGVTATDPTTLALSALTLAAAALVAGALPAWRAARLDPMTTLREE